jgi:hypothetical protein
MTATGLIASSEIAPVAFLIRLPVALPKRAVPEYRFLRAAVV